LLGPDCPALSLAARLVQFVEGFKGRPATKRTLRLFATSQWIFADPLPKVSRTVLKLSSHVATPTKKYEKRSGTRV
jgi:hypothetical protein